MLPPRDRELVQIVDRALESATERGAGWLACRPGCTPCCHGVFRISALDAERLRAAFQQLEEGAPERAANLRERARRAADALRPTFPGDPDSGLLHEEDERWDAFAELPEADLPCPVLDPATGSCELYAGRPLTCRVFGPPVRNEGGLGVCELCYVGASEAEIVSGEMRLEHTQLEAELDRELLAAGAAGETVIAFALLQAR